MANGLFRMFCVFSLTGLIHGTTENDIIYDLNKLITKNVHRYQNSLRAEHYGELYPFKFGDFSEDLKFALPDSLLQDSFRCLGDLVYIVKNIKSPTALKLLDSYGKPESGILQGNMHWVGGFDECLGIHSTNPNSSTVGNFRGKYCSASVSVKSQQTIMPLSITTAMCIPDSCSAEEFHEDVLLLLRMADIPSYLKNNIVSVFQNASIQCKPMERELSNASVAVIALLSFLSAFTLVGSSVTAFKYFKRIVQGYKKVSFIEDIVDSNHLVQGQKDMFKEKEDDNLPLQDDTHTGRNQGILHTIDAFLNCFCVFTNGSKILNTKTSEGELLCIHGIRFLSMSWVILGHAYLFGLQQMTNILALKEYVDTFLFQIVLQGFYSVDSFFVLSGFLLTYLAMNEFSKKNGSIPWPYFYIHRYIRLTPIYMLIVGFYTTIYLYLGSGPYWPVGDIDTNCHKYWWTNVLYINNFYDQSEQCMGWAWYLANDMQFFVISPLFLVTLWRWPKAGYSLIAIFMFACWLSNFVITYHFDLMAGAFNIEQALTASLSKFTDYFNMIYIKPYTRISPYLIGMLTGYLLYKRKEKNYPRHGLVFLCVGWIISTAVGLICVFVLYRQNPPLIGNSFYNALNRTGFALSLAWVIYACLVGQGGFVNGILSYKLFIPLSRLTYTAYLIHPMIMTGYFASMKTSMAFNHPTLMFLFLGFLITTYALSLPVALMLESPVIALEKCIRKSFAQRRNNQTVN